MRDWDENVDEWFNTTSSIKITNGEFDVIERGLFTGFDKLTEEIDRIFDDDHHESSFSMSHDRNKTNTVREEVDIILYSYYFTNVRPNKTLKVRKFRRNVRSESIRRANNLTSHYYNDPENKSNTRFTIPPLSRIETEGRESLDDLIVTDRNVKIVLQLPSNNRREDIKVIAYNDNSLTISHINSKEKLCHRTLVIPHNLDIETGRSTYRNGILEITFNKHEQR